jgi:hypothetical protein
MAFRAEGLQVREAMSRDDDLLVRYMRGLLRSGRLAVRQEDVRTCTHCGAHARFHPVDEFGWSACSACGGLA